MKQKDKKKSGKSDKKKRWFLFRQIKRNVALVEDSIAGGIEHPLEFVSFLLPLIIMGISVVCFVVALIMFIVRGGYTYQINAARDDIFNNIRRMMTSGTVGIVLNGVIESIIWILFALEMLVITCSYIITENAVKKIISAILYISSLVCFSVDALLFKNSDSLTRKQERLWTAILSSFDGSHTNGIMYVFCIGAVTLIILLVLTMFSKQKEKTKCALVAAIMSYIIIPVFSMIVENIIPLVLILIVTVIMVILTRYGCKLMDEYSKVSNERSKERLKERRERRESAKEREENADKAGKTGSNQYQKKVNLELNTNFWRSKGGQATNAPAADCVYCYDNQHTIMFVCTVQQFEQGKVAVYNKKKRITTVAGCKPPQR